MSAVFHFLSTCSSRDEQPVPFPSLWMSQQYSLVLIIWKCSQRKPPRHLPPVYQHVACAQPTGRTNRAIQTRDLERGLKQFNTIRRRESRGGCSTFGKGEDHSGTCSDSIRHSGQHAGASARLWRTDQVGEIKWTKKWFDVRTWWRIMGSSFEQQPVVRGY